MNVADLAIYFAPVQEIGNYSEGELGYSTIFYRPEEEFPEIERKSIVIFNCPEDRNSGVKSIDNSEKIRNVFYRLSRYSNWDFKIYDLGTILPGNGVGDTYYAVKHIVSELVKLECIPLLIGGTQDLTYAVYQGYQQLEQTVNIVNIDAAFDLGDPDTPISSANYISHILTSRPCTLFNYSIIGTQKPFLKEEEVELLEKLYFDQCRLGDLENDFKRAEPLIRNADILSFDLNALRSGDSVGSYYPNPNGIKQEVACQISKYAGLSDRLSCFFIANYYPLSTTRWYDQIVAQMLWYFMDGVAERYHDFPIVSLDKYSKFTVKMINPEEEIVFYKSNRSERWWMEVPYPENKSKEFKRQTVVPCNYEDYLQAMQNDFPNLWWKTFQKLL